MHIRSVILSDLISCDRWPASYQACIAFKFHWMNTITYWDAWHLSMKRMGKWHDATAISYQEQYSHSFEVWVYKPWKMTIKRPHCSGNEKNVRSSPLTVIMVLARGPRKHIPCLALQVARIMLFSGSHNHYEKLWARQLRMLPSVAKASFTSGYYAGLAQQCTAVDSPYASKRAPNLHLVTSG